MSIRIGINGFGRIGRYFARLTATTPDVELAVINDIMPADHAAHLLRHDSIFGKFSDVTVEPEGVSINGHVVPVTSKQPEDWNWQGCDIVIEATGRFTDRASCERHLKCGATRVIVAQPANDADITVVMGVNHHNIDHTHRIISNASCTTNALALPANVIERTFGIVRGAMTTIHPVTLRQNILDDPHPDLRRARACGMNLLPTPTGAHQTCAKVIPSLAGRLHGLAYRVPTHNTATMELVCELKTPADTAGVHAALQAASGKYMNFCTEPLVSADITGSVYGSVVDAEMTSVLDSTMLRLFAWYDNEAGFTNQLLRLCRYLDSQGLLGAAA